MTEELVEITTEVFLSMANIRLDLNLKPCSIDRCHVIGIIPVNNNRPIMVKFACYDQKQEVIKHRRKGRISKLLRKISHGIMCLSFPSQIDLTRGNVCLLSKARKNSHGKMCLFCPKPEITHMG